jgi:hypothetical protein
VLQKAAETAENDLAAFARFVFNPFDLCSLCFLLRKSWIADLRESQQNPECSWPYCRNFRRVLLRRFPYKVFYQVISQRIVIFRVLHAKQEHGFGLA